MMILVRTIQSPMMIAVGTTQMPSANPASSVPISTDSVISL